MYVCMLLFFFLFFFFLLLLMVWNYYFISARWLPPLRIKKVKVKSKSILNSEKLVIILALFPCDITLSYAPNPEKIPFNDVLKNLTNPYGYDCGYYRDEEITFCFISFQCSLEIKYNHATLRRM